MIYNIKNELKNLPIAVSAIALGFMGLSTIYLGFGVKWVRVVAFIFCSISLGLIALKTIFHPKKVLQEIKHPETGSIYPTIFMALMIMSSYILEFNEEIGKTIWISAIIAHFIYSIFFLKEMFIDFKLEKLLPSWFIVTVAIGIGAVAGKPMNIPIVSNTLFYYSFIMFIIIFPIMIYRLKKCSKLTQSQLPTMMIIVSPPSICLAAYMVLDINKNIMLATLLAVFCYVLILYNYILIPKLIQAKELPKLAPLTFPLSIGALACQRYVNYLKINENNISNLLENILYIQVLVATVVISYVVLLTLSTGYKKLISISNMTDLSNETIAQDKDKHDEDYDGVIAVTSNEEN